jgi:hypothetical protein
MSNLFSMNYDDTWTYLGDSINDLTKAIQENIKTVIKDTEV